VAIKSINPDGRAGNPGYMERYNQVDKVARQTIAATRKRFAGSTPVRSPTSSLSIMFFDGQSVKIVRFSHGRIAHGKCYRQRPASVNTGMGIAQGDGTHIE